MNSGWWRSVLPDGNRTVQYAGILIGASIMVENEAGLRSVHGDIHDYRQYLRDITAIQAETVRRLVESDSTPPMEMAAVLEDIANKFLDMSDEVRDFALARPEAC
jgi:hypothetical protein